MEPSLRYRGDIQIPLARPMAILPATKDRLPGPTVTTPEGEASQAAEGQAPLLLLPEQVAWRHTEHWRPAPDRAVGLMVGLRVAEVMAAERRGQRPPLPRAAPVTPGPAAREAGILGELALRTPISPRKFAAALADAIAEADHPAWSLLAPYRSTGNWRDAGTQEPSPGAALRVAPLAIILADDPSALVVESVSASLVTHRDIRSISGAVTVAWAIREVLSYGGLSGREVRAGRSVELLESLGARCRSAERVLVRRCAELLAPSWRETQHTLSNLIFRTTHLVDQPVEAAVQQLRSAVPRRNDEPLGEASLDGILAVPLGLLLAVTGPDGFEEAMERVLAVPSVPAAAVTLVGTLLGARWGSAGIPEALGRGVHGHERTVTLARALAGDPCAIRETRI